MVEANRNARTAEFVQRPESVATHGGLNHALYVDELFNVTGITAIPAGKPALVVHLTSGAKTRELARYEKWWTARL